MTINKKKLSSGRAARPTEIFTSQFIRKVTETTGTNLDFRELLLNNNLYIYFTPNN